MNFKTIEWKGDYIRILDQRRLPHEVHYLVCKDALSIERAIKKMAIRGAPAIGVAAAMGIALAAKKTRTKNIELFRRKFDEICFRLGEARPTAINLSWAINRMKDVLKKESFNIEEIKVRLEEEALKIYEEDIKTNKKIGEYGKDLIPDGVGILTHCNAGALATAGYGTALGVIYAAWQQGKRFHVYVDETRPLLQGARLTAWELKQAKIPLSIITDNMAGWLIKNKKINLIIVGADRIAKNGDTANKIGTYSLAVLANFHRIPFYVAAPSSTFDLKMGCGENIPIEERSEDEVTHIGRKRIIPQGIKVYNPAFDVTPHDLIDAIITEKGIIRKPFKKYLKSFEIA
jgi:methylthioribose-1-phosphate isomerase